MAIHGHTIHGYYITCIHGHCKDLSMMSKYLCKNVHFAGQGVAVLDTSFLFVSVAVETCGTFGLKAGGFFRELGRRVRRATDKANAYQYLVQSIAIAVQWGNAASVLGSPWQPAMAEAPPPCVPSTNRIQYGSPMYRCERR